MSHLTNSFGQKFTAFSSKVLSAIRVNADTPFVSLTLANGHTLNASIDAVSRAVGNQLSWAHLPMLKGAEISYLESERVEGQDFTWRPDDTTPMTATSSAKFKTLSGVFVREKYEDTIESLPVYVSGKAVAPQDVTDDVKNEIPDGVVVEDEEPKPDKKANKK